MENVFVQEKARLDEYVNAVRPAPGQCGAVFAIDGRVAGLELFDSPGSFARYGRRENQMMGRSAKNNAR